MKEQFEDPIIASDVIDCAGKNLLAWHDDGKKIVVARFPTVKEAQDAASSLQSALISYHRGFIEKE